MDGEWDVQNQDNFDPAAGEGEAGGPAEDAMAPAGTAQDAAPTASAVVEAAVGTAEATMGAAPAASATGAEAAAAKPEDLGTAGLALQGRMICAAATAALENTADAKDIKDGQYSPETPSGTYSPVTLSYSSDAAMSTQQDRHVRAAAGCDRSGNRCNRCRGSSSRARGPWCSRAVVTGTVDLCGSNGSPEEDGRCQEL